jgi:hypothetical protein
VREKLKENDVVKRIMKSWRNVPVALSYFIKIYLIKLYTFKILPSYKIPEITTSGANIHLLKNIRIFVSLMKILLTYLFHGAGYYLKS